MYNNIIIQYMGIYIKLGLTIIIRILLSRFCLYELMDYYGYQVYYIYIYDDYNNYLGTIPSPPTPSAQLQQGAQASLFLAVDSPNVWTEQQWGRENQNPGS